MERRSLFHLSQGRKKRTIQFSSTGSFHRSFDNELVAHFADGVDCRQLFESMADAILDCSARGEIVLDAFLGSGTTLMAAERVGRVCYGIEIDPLYVDVAIRRWQNYTGEDATHETRDNASTNCRPRR